MELSAVVLSEFLAGAELIEKNALAASTIAIVPFSLPSGL